jgi:hypothetical protein
MKPSDWQMVGIFGMWIAIFIFMYAVGMRAKKRQTEHRRRCPCRDCEQWRIHHNSRVQP